MIVKFEFDQDVETVYQTMTDTEFLIQRALKLGNHLADAKADSDGDNVVIKLNRTRMIKVPSILSALISDEQTATSKEVWSRVGDKYICESKADIDGAPLELAGKITLSPNGSGCLYVAEVDVKAKVMIGRGTLKKYASKTVAKELELECEFTAKHLA